MGYLFCLQLSPHDNNEDYNNEFWRNPVYLRWRFMILFTVFLVRFADFLHSPRHGNRRVTNDHCCVFHLFERLEPSLGCFLFCSSICTRLWHVFCIKYLWNGVHYLDVIYLCPPSTNIVFERLSPGLGTVLQPQSPHLFNGFLTNGFSQLWC